MSLESANSNFSYQHGWQQCRQCHRSGKEVTNNKQWTLTANPGYWGSSDPRVLVLGFSKGANQTREIAAHRPFEAVAFARRRERLGAILRRLGAPFADQTIDQTMTRSSKELGYASLVRCSFEKDGRTSGSIMADAVADPWASAVVGRCIQAHLAVMPDSVQRVVLLGTTPAYIKGVKAQMKSVFPDYAEINAVAFKANGRVWVFVVHPATKDNRYREWMEDAADTSAGHKREMAVHAFGTLAPAQPRLISVGTKRVIKRVALVD